MAKDLKALVIGCGLVGGGYNSGPADELVMTHAMAYRRHPKFSLVACVDPDEGARRSFMQRWDVPHGFASLEEALSGEIEFDVASVTAPTRVHIKILRQLLSSPVRVVFAEKPLGGDPVEASRIVTAYEEARKPLLVGYLRRFDPSMQALRDEIARGEWGAIRGIAGVYGRGVVNNGSHMIDLVRFLTGEKSIEVVAVLGRRDDGVPGDPTVDANLRLEDGTLMHLMGVDGRDYALFEMSLFCSNGVVDIENGGLSMRRRRAVATEIVPGVCRLQNVAAESTRWGEAYGLALDGLVSALTTGDTSVTNGSSAVMALNICDSLRKRAVETIGAR